LHKYLRYLFFIVCLPNYTGAVNLEELLSELIECGLEVRACGMALNDCSIDESAMLPGIERGSMKALANWVKNSEHVMVF